jgi:hypothetical protein
VYGFHKVPHLHDGALHTENAPEVWEFTNEHFTRSNPDLQSIVRAKTETEKARSAKRQASPDIKPRPTTYPAIEAASSSPAAPPGFSVVYEEIRNIKRLQSSFLAELKRLKSDNDSLWIEAGAARARHDQQQSTINKMLKFLSTVFSPTKPNTGSLNSRNRGLIMGPSAFEELTDDPSELSNTVLTPEAQETGARELSDLFGGIQPILPQNAGDAAWWQNLVKNEFPPPTPPYSSHPDDVALYSLTAPSQPSNQSLNQHRNSLAAMEHAVNQTDQSIGRIAGVLGVNDWDNFDLSSLQNPPAVTSLSYDPLMDPQSSAAVPDYQFDEFLRSMSPFEVPDLMRLDTDENGTIIDQNDPDFNSFDTSQSDVRFESLSREPSPNGALRATSGGDMDDLTRKRTRSQTFGQGLSPPVLKKSR